MSTGESLYFLGFRKKGAEYVLSIKEERQKIDRENEEQLDFKKSDMTIQSSNDNENLSDENFELKNKDDEDNSSNNNLF